MAITQRCNLLRSVANALFTQKLHANFTSGLMYFHGRDRLRRRVLLLCCLQATSHFVSYDQRCLSIWEVVCLVCGCGVV